MDVQMAAVPTTPTATATSSTTAANKGTSKGNASTTSFSALLADQTGQDNAPATDGQPTDSELSMTMMIQMLQTLVMPLQTAAEQGATTKTEEHSLPELLVEALNSNPDLAGKLLQDPKVKKWFENADDMLAALGNNSNTAGLGLIANLQQPTNASVNLKVQNTLLTLTTLSKQQPDNPILNYLKADLTNTIQPLLPEILATLGGPQKPAASPVTANPLASDDAVDTGKKQATSATKASAHKYINKRAVEQPTENIQTINLQSVQSKQEKFAIKYIPIAINELASNATEEKKAPLVDVPVESNSTTNTIVTIADLQKAQQVTNVEKTAAPVLSAANFTEEMTAHVLKNMKITMSEGFSEAKLSLFPKNLGHVDVKISMHDGQLFAQFAADTLAGKQMLESQLPQLRQALLTQGLQVEKLEVTQSANMSSSMFQEQRQPQSFNQSQQQPRNRSNAVEIDAIEFKDDMEQLAQVREAANGNSFDVIA
ncbi:hypothetical protein A8709_19765 [Paenibacillus pectinilyticus]|uniref:Flagellar hook-length control protein-like C-terminal domain-containing protein n=1 Tax=Paenibacillus pectinilyticus TaxID=512399 RepID=A0A1C1A0A5_9BACL|nr:flagellar hook-length control protein FliK [Paenibacillus pectinilyticus]OCT13813.1 hypothetical protein A8709_19765 [Paenibacillus pectinilyticus]